MTHVVLIRGIADLPRACDELSAFFAARLRQDPPLLPEALSGMWVEPRLAAEIPHRLNVPGHGGCVRILESVGLPDIWALCRLGGFGEAAGGGLCRLDLVQALLDTGPPGGNDAPKGCFIPVFSARTAEPDVQAECLRLKRRHPALVLEPFYQEAGTGRLFTPARRDAQPGESR